MPLPSKTVSAVLFFFFSTAAFSLARALVQNKPSAPSAARDPSQALARVSRQISARGPPAATVCNTRIFITIIQYCIWVRCIIYVFILVNGRVY